MLTLAHKEGKKQPRPLDHSPKFWSGRKERPVCIVYILIQVKLEKGKWGGGSAMPEQALRATT